MADLTSEGAALTAPSGKRNFRTIALIIASAMFMEQLDATVLSTALPAMAQHFGVSAPHMSIALTSYLLSLAVLIPASGKVADRFGSRTVFALAIGVFTLGSILCAQAPNLPFLVFARFLQGAGGAMMMPVGRLVLLRSVDKRDLVSATSWLLVPALVGPILGPPVGGFIVTYLDWRWIFYINVPIGILGIGLVLAFIENVKSDTREPFDIVGFILSGIALACLLFGFELSSHEGPAVFLALALVAMGLITGTLYVFHARRHPAPILDLSLMRVPTYSLALVAGSLSRVTQGAQPFLLPLMMQIGFGLSAAQSGLLTFATACGSMLMKGAAAGILRRFGFRTTLIWNSLFSSALYALCAAFRPDWPHWAIYAVLLVCGFSMSLQFTAFNTVAYDDIPSRRMSAATSFYTTFQQMMLSLGICIGALILHASSRIAGHGQPTLDDFSVAFLVVTAVSLAASPVSALFPADAGAVMSGHKARRGGDAET